MLFIKKMIFWFFLYFIYIIQHYFICRPSDSVVSAEPRAVATIDLAARHYNLSTKSHPLTGYDAKRS